LSSQPICEPPESYRSGPPNYGIKTPNPASPKAYRIWHAPA
jgi:hypothetical protein